MKAEKNNKEGASHSSGPLQGYDEYINPPVMLSTLSLTIINCGALYQAKMCLTVYKSTSSSSHLWLVRLTGKI